MYTANFFIFSSLNSCWVENKGRFSVFRGEKRLSITNEEEEDDDRGRGGGGGGGGISRGERRSSIDGDKEEGGGGEGEIFFCLRGGKRLENRFIFFSKQKMKRLTVEQEEAIQRMEQMDQKRKKQEEEIKVFSGWKMSVFYVSEMVTMIAMGILFLYSKDAISVIQGMVTCASVVVFIVLYYRPVHFSLLFFVFLRILVWIWYVMFILFGEDYKQFELEKYKSFFISSCFLQPVTFCIYLRRIWLYEPL